MYKLHNNIKSNIVDRHNYSCFFFQAIKKQIKATKTQIIAFHSRCSRPKKTHERLGSGKHEEPYTPSVNYSSKDDSLHISPPPSDVTYDTVYDQAESPFRRTQRLIRMGSANAWRQAPHRRHGQGQGRTDASDSSSSDYTWRGLIGGKMEVINTELRHQYPENSVAAACARAERLTPESTLRTRCDVHEPLRFTDGDYDLPDRRVSEPHFVVSEVQCIPSPERVTYRRQSDVQRPRGSEAQSREPSFLEFQSGRNSLNEENIYASIKKTFQKIKADLAAQAQRAEQEEDQMMYSVRLTDV